VALDATQQSPPGGRPRPRPAREAEWPAAPHALAYDDLPPGSDLRRQYGEGGSVIVTAPAGEPSQAVCRAAAHSTGLAAALICGPCLLLALGMYAFADRSGGIDPRLRPLAVLVFAVFCGGVFLLAWKVMYSTRLRMLAEARGQATVLHANSTRLLVETTGPYGDRSFDVPSGAIRSLQIMSGGAFGGPAREPVSCLKLTTSDGTVYRVLPGRHEGELRWVAATLRHALSGLEPHAVQ
jgi:hypothetical protein